MAAGGGGGGNGFSGSPRGFSNGGNGRTSTVGGNSNILTGSYGNPAPVPAAVESLKADHKAMAAVVLWLAAAAAT